MKSITDQEQRILDVLVFEGKLPSRPFEISEDHLLSYMHAYVNVLNKKSFNLANKNYRYTRKLAALTVMKYLSSIGGNIISQPSGFVYVIMNPSFPEHYKIGMTVDLDARLTTYQTYDPYRNFSVLKYEFVLNRKHTEEKILNSFDISLENGEWVKRDKVERVFKNITHTYDKILAP
jgi:hypothetical protein